MTKSKKVGGVMPTQKLDTEAAAAAPADSIHDDESGLSDAEKLQHLHFGLWLLFDELKDRRDACRAALGKGLDVATNSAAANVYAEIFELVDELNMEYSVGGRAPSRAPSPSANLNERERKALHRIIAVMLESIMAKSSTGQPNSKFNSNASLIDVMLVDHDTRDGISKTNLELVFSKAKQALRE